MANWPKQVFSELEPRDFCRSTHTDGNRHDLIGWMTECFYPDWDGVTINPVIAKVLRTFVAVIGKQDLDIAKRRKLPLWKRQLYAIMDWNDDSEIPLSEIAQTWNVAMQQLGYVEPVE